MIPRALLLLCLTCPATAGVVSRDLFEPGDGLLTYDEVNQREWLDFSVSSNYSLSDLASALESEGPLAGFVLANRAAVNDLAITASDDIEGLKGRPGPFESSELLSLLAYDIYEGNFYVDHIASTFSHMVIGPSVGSETFPNNTRVHVLSPTRVPNYNIRVNINGEWVYGYRIQFYDPATAVELLEQAGSVRSYWLYRDAVAVPEPAAVWLALVSGLTALRHRDVA